MVNDTRVEAMKQLLQDSQSRKIPLITIALDCGFNSQSSFNALFEQHSGLTPSDYSKTVIKKAGVNAYPGCIFYLTQIYRGSTGGCCGFLKPFFCISSSTTAMAFSNCASPPLASAVGSSITSISGSTP